MYIFLVTANLQLKVLCISTNHFTDKRKKKYPIRLGGFRVTVDSIFITNGGKWPPQPFNMHPLHVDLELNCDEFDEI